MSKPILILASLLACVMLLVGAGCGNEVTAPERASYGIDDDSSKRSHARNVRNQRDEILVNPPNMDDGMIVGTVTPAVSATISVYRRGTMQLVAQTTTSAVNDGFSVAVPTGRYDVMASAGGFADAWKNNVKVKPGATRTVNFSLVEDGGGGE